MAEAIEIAIAIAREIEKIEKRWSEREILQTGAEEWDSEMRDSSFAVSRSTLRTASFLLLLNERRSEFLVFSRDRLGLPLTDVSIDLFRFLECMRW